MEAQEAERKRKHSREREAQVEREAADINVKKEAGGSYVKRREKGSLH